MKEIISLTPLRSGREYLYPSPQLPSPTKSRTVCICNAHTDRLSFHYRAPSSRRIVRTASNSNPSTRNWGGGRGRGWSRWSQHVPRRVSKDSPSLLRFGDKPSFLSANSKHWSLSRPPSIVLPLPPLFASVWNVVPLPCEGESDRECIGSLPPTIGRARSCYIDRLDFIPPPPDPITLNNLSANYKR